MTIDGKVYTIDGAAQTQKRENALYARRIHVLEVDL
jgi:hypothetical protein